MQTHIYFSQKYLVDTKNKTLAKSCLLKQDNLFVQNLNLES